VLQNSFWITDDKFSGLWARRTNIDAGGTTSFSDELTGDFGGAFEATLIDGCRLFVVLRKNRCKPFLEFCNTIGTFATCQLHRTMSAFRGNPEDMCSC
jgi:hypothetical protein